RMRRDVLDALAVDVDLTAIAQRFQKFRAGERAFPAGQNVFGAGFGVFGHIVLPVGLDRISLPGSASSLAIRQYTDDYECNDSSAQRSTVVSDDDAASHGNRDAQIRRR